MINSIRLENITKRYNSSNFSLDMKDLHFQNGHIHIITGPNGSGKSTLLNLLGFLDKPDKGNILVDGESVSSNSHNNGLRKKIGFIRQSPYLFNDNVRENIALGLKIRRYPRDEIVSKVSDILAELKIEHLKHRIARLWAPIMLRCSW